jgi:hypothetical protein
MPLLHRPSKYHPGDLIVCAKPSSKPNEERGHFRYDDWIIQTDLMAAVISYLGSEAKGLLVGANAKLRITPYSGGGYKIRREFRYHNRKCGASYGDILGRVSGPLEVDDLYATKKFLKRVAKRYHSTIYERCMEGFRARRDEAAEILTSDFLRI